MKLEIRTPDKKIFSGEVIGAHFQAEDGGLSVLPGHAPLATVLVPGQVRYKLGTGEDVSIDVGAGFLIVAKDSVQALTALF